MSVHAEHVRTLTQLLVALAATSAATRSTVLRCHVVHRCVRRLAATWFAPAIICIGLCIGTLACDAWLAFIDAWLPPSFSYVRSGDVARVTKAKHQRPMRKWKRKRKRKKRRRRRTHRPRRVGNNKTKKRCASRRRHDARLPTARTLPSLGSPVPPPQANPDAVLHRTIPIVPDVVVPRRRYPVVHGVRDVLLRGDGMQRAACSTHPCAGCRCTARSSHRTHRATLGQVAHRDAHTIGKPFDGSARGLLATRHCRRQWWQLVVCWRLQLVVCCWLQLVVCCRLQLVVC